MKQIKDGKLYDTETAEFLGDIIPGRSLYRTKNGNYFVVLDQIVSKNITMTDTESIKEIVGEYNPDLYVKVFGEVEEA